MKRASITIKAFGLSVSLLLLALPVDAQAAPYNVSSDSNSLWTVSDANGNDLGTAQTVCLNAGPNCPAGATPYGYALPGWTADLSPIPGAKWIWAPNVSGTTSPAANTEFTIQTQFWLCDNATAGKIWVAADNSAEVLINGQSVLTSTDHSVLAMVDLAASNRLSSLNRGLNIIQVKVKNAANPADCGSDQYQCNPAGVVLGASFEDGLNALPTCTSGGRTYTLGEFETLACPAGKTGSRGRPCICVGSIGFWGPVYDACMSPPATCSSNGVTFAVGSTEMLSCPVGQLGSRTRTCNSGGSWGEIADTCRPPPPADRTCTSNGVTFAANTTETLFCPAGQTGSRTRTCKTDGTWGPITDTCQLPPVVFGAICGARDKGLTGICPAGTTCGPRRLPQQATPWWCVFFVGRPLVPDECRRSENLQTADWFCDPP